MPRRVIHAKDQITRTYVYISSRDRTNLHDPTTNFKVEPLNFQTEVKQFSIDQLSIHNFYYNVNAKNNWIIWDDMSQANPANRPSYFRLSLGSYTAQEYAAALQAGFRNSLFLVNNQPNQTHNQFSVQLIDDVDQLSPKRKIFKFRFLSTQPFRIYTREESLREHNNTFIWKRQLSTIEMMGLSPVQDLVSIQQQGAFVAESPNCINMNPNSYIYFCSKALSKTSTEIFHSGNTKYPNLIAKLPLHSSHFGDISVYDISGLQFTWDPGYNIPIDIQILDSDGDVIENNGGHVELKLTFYKHDLPIEI